MTFGRAGIKIKHVNFIMIESAQMQSFSYLIRGKFGENPVQPPLLC
ncbi:hypothetical protein CLOL250_01123 [Clostridium sp. L2-50]|nr:hypothetical protein CLOL250_01123 [Clostridium sp. L2-50]